MKKLSLLATLFCLFLAGAISAQDKTASSFAGTWELDAAKSKLPERMRVESGTLSVAQTDKNLTVATDFKRAARPSQTDETGGMREGGNRGMREGGGGRGMMGGGNGTLIYNLEGDETIIESDPPAGTPTGTLRLKAEFAKDGKLKLISKRTLETQTGAMTVKTVDVWELLDNGKTLKITRETETPRGSQSAEMYFTRKDSAANDAPRDSISSYQSPGMTVAEQSSAVSVAPNLATKMISGGVLNGKALKLVQPEVPPAAIVVHASGTVNVQVMLDEQGKVVSASAVSGHPLLRAAAEKAARQSEFAPTLLSGVPMKVTGIITYKFEPAVVTTTDN